MFFLRNHQMFLPYFFVISQNRIPYPVLWDVRSALRDIHPTPQDVHPAARDADFVGWGSFCPFVYKKVALSAYLFRRVKYIAKSLEVINLFLKFVAKLCSKINRNLK